MLIKHNTFIRVVKIFLCVACMQATTTHSSLSSMGTMDYQSTLSPNHCTTQKEILPTRNNESEYLQIRISPQLQARADMVNKISSVGEIRAQDDLIGECLDFYINENNNALGVFEKFFWNEKARCYDPDVHNSLDPVNLRAEYRCKMVQHIRAGDLQEVIPFEQYSKAEILQAKKDRPYILAALFGGFGILIASPFLWSLMRSLF